MSHIIRPAAAILLSRDSRVWLGKRGNTRFLPGFWAFPGGRQEENESAQECAYRELEEETGVQLSQSLRPFARAITPPFSPLRYDLFVFHAELSKAQEPRVDGREFFEGSWFSFVEILKLRSQGELQLAPPTFTQLQSFDQIDKGIANFPSPEDAFIKPQQEVDMVMEMTEGITVIPMRSSIMPFPSWTNCLLAGKKNFFLIDPGGDDPSLLQQELARRTSLGAKLKGVILTHHHCDHLSAYLKLGLNELPLYCHPLTAALLPREFPRSKPWNDLEPIEVEPGFHMVAHLTPGHAPGHLAIEFPERQTLLAGDLISSLSSIVIPSSNGDLSAYLQSLTRMRELECRLVIPSHGPPYGQGSDPFGAAISHRQKREEMLYELLAKEDTPLGLEVIRDRLYRGLDRHLLPAAEANIWHHLQKLQREGLVSLESDGWMLAKPEP